MVEETWEEYNEEPIGTELKQRGAVATLNKHNKTIADAITDRHYEVRHLNQVVQEIYLIL